MSYATKAEAYNTGRAVIRKLNGKGWRLQVFENAGWHFTILNGALSLHLSEYPDGKKYWCMMADTPEAGGCGAMMFHHNYSSKDPNDAVRHQLRLARKVVEGINTTLENVEKRVLPKKR